MTDRTADILPTNHIFEKVTIIKTGPTGHLLNPTLKPDATKPTGHLAPVPAKPPIPKK